MNMCKYCYPLITMYFVNILAKIIITINICYSVNSHPDEHVKYYNQAKFMFGLNVAFLIFTYDHCYLLLLNMASPFIQKYF